MAAVAVPAAACPIYERRRPEESVLHQTVVAHLDSFLASHEVPGFVAKALRRYVDCGVLARGFVRVHCDACGQDALVAFSCKDRGFCPSCTARRAAQTAAHLVDEVLPHFPMRQWVLAMPFDLHHRLARDGELQTKVLAVFFEELTATLRSATGSAEDAPTGAVTAIQLFGSSANLHVHYHLLSFDGVCQQQPDGTVVLQRAPTPQRWQVQELVERIAVRARAIVGRARAQPEEEVVLAPALKLMDTPPEREAPELVAEHDGFNLHASVAFEAEERVALERFCRYAFRGAIAQGRLTRGPNDTVVYRLKSPRSDGTTHVAFSPMGFLQRLSWLVPLPRVHLTRFHGVLAPGHPWRSLVVPKPPATAPPIVGGRRRRWIAWADLLKRAFAVEVLVCACGGKRRVMAVIREGPVARMILAHLGLPTEPPRLRRAQIDPQGDLWGTGPPTDTAPAGPDADFVEPPPDDDLDQRWLHPAD